MHSWQRFFSHSVSSLFNLVTTFFYAEAF
jgi:hypothetical protein